MPDQRDEQIEELISKTIDISSHSQIVLKVLNLFKNEFTSIEEIENLISKDKGFTARFIRIANSPFYGFSRQIKSIKEALFLLGLDTAKSLILATSSRYLYKTFDSFEQSLWEHSLAVGLCTSLLAELKNTIKPQEALACGILHDIGVLFLKNAFLDAYLRIYEKIYEMEKDLVELEIESIGYSHTEVGAYVADKWNFPKEIMIAMKCHHLIVYEEEDKYENIFNLVKIADQICLNLGIGLKRPIKKKIEFAKIGLTLSELDDHMFFFQSYFREQKRFLIY